MTERIAGNDSRAVVDALAPGEGSMDLQAVAHLSSNSQFECVKQGTPAPVQKIDMASIGIDEPAAAYRIWPKVPCRGQGRQNYIGVAAVEWLVYTMRADITD